MKTLIALTLGLLLFVIAAKADVTPESPDRAEVIAISAPSKSDDPRVQLNAKQALELAEGIHALDLSGPAGGCDKAQYEMRLYHGKNLLSDDRICFNCGCFQSQGADAKYFDYTDPRAIRLKEFIEHLFSAAPKK